MRVAFTLTLLAFVALAVFAAASIGVRAFRSAPQAGNAYVLPAAAR